MESIQKDQLYKKNIGLGLFAPRFDDLDQKLQDRQNFGTIYANFPNFYLYVGGKIYV